jgi:hypothetical protein
MKLITGRRPKNKGKKHNQQFKNKEKSVRRQTGPVIFLSFEEPSKRYYIPEKVLLIGNMAV